MRWQGPGGPQQAWQAQIVGALVEQRQYARAHAVWSRITGIGNAAAGIFNPQFDKADAPPPFNWTFATSGGVADPLGMAACRSFITGVRTRSWRNNCCCSAPGQYRLGMEVNGQPGDGSAISWSLTCLPRNQVVFSLPLKHGQRASAGSFAVPQGCPAQRLELTGSIGEFPQSIDFTIGKLQLCEGGGPMMATLRAAIVPVYILLCIMLGGSAQGIWGNMVLQLLGIGIIAWTLLSADSLRMPKSAKPLFVIAAATVALVAVQLIPLPPGLWQALPGRQPIAEGFVLLGQQAPGSRFLWRPMRRWRPR